LYSQTEDNIREEVRVINIEVPVRVYNHGKPVDNLTRADFTLYEGKKCQSINGFYLKKRKIEALRLKQSPQDLKYPTRKPRLFILVFHLANYNSDLKKGVAYLFNHILRERDQIIVFVNDTTIILNNPALKESKAQLEATLSQESVKANHRLAGYFNKIQRSLKFTKTELEMRAQAETNVPVDTRPAQIISFLKYYLSTWKEYKKKYLLPDINKYYNFTNFLAKINKEKWVINFYQIEMFPKMKLTGDLRQQIELITNQMLSTDGEGVQYARMILNLLKDIELELNVARDFDADEISKFFYKTDATCHSIFSWIRKESGSQDLEFSTVSTDIENSLREITSKTGGALIKSNDLKTALNSIAQQEDTFYMLTFAPSNPEKVGKIRVKVKNKKYRVTYDNNTRADYIREYVANKNATIPTITINSISFKKKQLFLTIGNFLIHTNNLRKHGRIKVRVWIVDKTDKIIYDQSKYFAPPQETLTVSINFNWLTLGKYSIFVDTTDIATGKNSLNYLQPQIQ
jgi:hypothetical protein